MSPSPPAHFSGKQKLAFAERLGDDWRDLTDYLTIAPAQRRRFTPGREPQDIWEWLEARQQLTDLPQALLHIGREDIVRDVLAPSPSLAPGATAAGQGVPSPEALATAAAPPPPTTVYLSYAWGDAHETGSSREDIVDQLYDALCADGYTVKRDKMDLGYKGLISAFMQEIGRGDCIVVVISNKYLTSPFCMFELLEMYRHQEFHDRICPIVLADARLHTLPERLAYVAHWKAELARIEGLIQQVGIQVLSASGSFQEYEKYREITNHADKLLTYLADINSQTPQMLAANDFATLKRAIDARLHRGRSDQQKESPHRP